MNDHRTQLPQIARPGPNCGCKSRLADASTRLNSFTFRWLLPSVALALMPKCPACFGLYFALVTGIGLSFTTASYLRTIAIVVCVAVLLYSAARPARRLLHRLFSKPELAAH
jgi:hypothetical protein